MDTNKRIRLTLSGPPGCGKSTLLQALPKIGFFVVDHFEQGRKGKQPLEIALIERAAPMDQPASIISMLLWCPECGARHVDKGEFATKAHHTHACQGCGHVWRPAIVATVGVQFLPGFKNA